MVSSIDPPRAREPAHGRLYGSLYEDRLSCPPRIDRCISRQLWEYSWDLRSPDYYGEAVTQCSEF